jgi:hypothetical protein
MIGFHEKNHRTNCVILLPKTHAQGGIILYKFYLKLFKIMRVKERQWNDSD